ncbi:hypothetical protein LXL04_016992 [Taraxacum kok-saghyz]
MSLYTTAPRLSRLLRPPVLLAFSDLQSLLLVVSELLLFILIGVVQSNDPSWLLQPLTHRNLRLRPPKLHCTDEATVDHALVSTAFWYLIPSVEVTMCKGLLLLMAEAITAGAGVAAAVIQAQRVL